MMNLIKRDKACHFLGYLCAAFLYVCAGNTHALEFQVTDNKGNSLEDAVVMIISKNGQSLSANEKEKVMIDQRDKEFAPYMTALSVGSYAVFPNNDKIRHQVYSFSDAKKFEIPLYKDAPEQPINFDKTGVVALACNIHDWMKAYIFVSPTPLYAITNLQGKAKINNLPEGQLEVQVWHPRLKGKPESTSQTISSSSTQTLSFKIDTKRIWRAHRAPSQAASGGYR